MPRSLFPLADNPETIAARADSVARAKLGISFKEFEYRWYKGAYRDNLDPAVTDVAAFLAPSLAVD